MRLTLSTRIVVRVLLGAALLLGLGHAAVKFAEFGLGHGRLLGLNPLLDINGEGNLPAWFSSMLLLATAGAAGFAAAVFRRRGAAWRHWAGLAVLFVALSIDEAASIHELFDRLRGVLDTSGLLFFPWVIPGTILAATVALSYLPFLRRLPRPIAARMIAGGGLFVAGAVGVELLQAMVWTTAGRETVAIAAFTLAEELLEMTGVIVFLDAVLRHVAVEVSAIDVAIGETPEPVDTVAPPQRRAA